MKKRPTRSKGRSAHARPSSTALARRKPAAAARQTGVEVVTTLAPPAPDEASRNLLTSDIALGELGLVEIKLTVEEERILARPVNPADILIKPTGAPYLSHPVYTRWLNEAFGRTGWALVPASKPIVQDKTVVQPFVLYIHGQPAAFAMGEQEYFESNRDQTYGDALESTVASGLRRCCKRLGIGLELWDRAYTEEWKHEHAVAVSVQGKDKKQWRRRRDRPFWNEVRGGRQDQGSEIRDRDERPAGGTEAPARQARPPAHHAASGEPITQGQRQRLYVIVQNSGRSEQEVSEYLQRRYGVASSKDLKRSDYEAVCAAIESPAPLV